MNDQPAKQSVKEVCTEQWLTQVLNQNPFFFSVTSPNSVLREVQCMFNKDKFTMHAVSIIQLIKTDDRIDDIWLLLMNIGMV